VNDESRKELLLRFLGTAVPAEIHRVAAMRQRERLRLAAELGQYTAGNGADILYYGIRQDADTAKAAAMLATCLAMGALEVGGITFLGRHWCARHDECLAGETPAARKAEIIQGLAKRASDHGSTSSRPRVSGDRPGYPRRPAGPGEEH
jgi:hypothetical protein